MLVLSKLAAKDGFNQMSKFKTIQNWLNKLYKNEKVKSRDFIKFKVFKYSSFIKNRMKNFMMHKLSLGC